MSKNRFPPQKKALPPVRVIPEEPRLKVQAESSLLELTDPRYEALMLNKFQLEWWPICKSYGARTMGIFPVWHGKSRFRFDRKVWDLERMGNNKTYVVPATVKSRLTNIKAAGVVFSYYVWADEVEIKPTIQVDRRIEEVVRLLPRQLTWSQTETRQPLLDPFMAGAIQLSERESLYVWLGYWPHTEDLR